MLYKTIAEVGKEIEAIEKALKKDAEKRREEEEAQKVIRELKEAMKIK